MASRVDLEAGVPLGPLETPVSSHARHHPVENVVTSPQRLNHAGLYSQIRGYRQAQAHDADDDFYGSTDVENVAVKGFPSIAAFHTKYPNTRTCRAFDLLTQKLMTTYQYKITCLEGALMDLDVEAATGATGETGGRPYPFDKDKFISRCMQSPDQLSLVQARILEEGEGGDEERRKEHIDARAEFLIANIEHILGLYRKHILWLYELRKLPRASVTTHERMFAFLQSLEGLNPDSLDYLRAYDDMIYADGDTLKEGFYKVAIYIRDALVKTIGFLRCNTTNEGFGEAVYSERHIKFAVHIMIVISISLIALLPVGIIVLGELEKGFAFLVVGLFGVLFTFVFLLFDSRVSHGSLGAWAYLALLITAWSIYN